MAERRVLMIGHFPPPTHGMSASFEALATQLSSQVAVHRVTTAGPALSRGAGYHAVRVMRCLRAVAALVTGVRRGRVVIFSVDNGRFTPYTIVLTAVARLLRYHCLLQHHSYSYVRETQRAMQVLVRLAGEDSVHLVTCERMALDFHRRYPRSRAAVLGVAYGMEVPPLPGPRPVPDSLRLGLLSNLNAEKGLWRAIDLLRAVRGAGVEATLTLAGPLTDAGDRSKLERAVAESRGAIGYLGPVYGEERDRFFADIDVFVFPTSYGHESFGLAAWEAMLRGVAVVAYEAGCLNAVAVGGAGVVIERDTEFAPGALACITEWTHDPESLRRAREAARTIAVTAVEDSRARVRDLARQLRARLAG